MMHSRSSIRSPGRQQPAIPHSSTIAAPSAWPYGNKTASPHAIRGSQTMPDTETDPFEIMHSKSGNLAWRGRSAKEEASRAKAEDLIGRLELSDTRNLELNKSGGNFPRETRMTPSLGGTMMTTAQASAILAQNQKKEMERAQHDPLLNERERAQNTGDPWFQSAETVAAESPVIMSRTPPSAHQPTSSQQNKVSAEERDGPNAVGFELQLSDSRDEGLNKVASFDDTVSSLGGSVVTVSPVIMSPGQQELRAPPPPATEPTNLNVHNYPASTVEPVVRRTPLGASNNLPYYDAPAKMTRSQKRAEIARQTRLRMAVAAKSKKVIPELC